MCSVLLFDPCPPCETQRTSYIGSRGWLESRRARWQSVISAYPSPSPAVTHWSGSSGSRYAAGQTVGTWLDLSEEERGNFETAKKTITGKLMLAPFVTLDEFHRRKLLPGEALSVFVHDLKKLLGQAMSNLDAEARDQLLLHQFLAGIPPVIGRQLRATGEAKTLEAAVERARLLMTLDDQAHATVVREGAGDVDQLKEQIGKLTEQVAALTTASLRTINREQRCCFASVKGNGAPNLHSKPSQQHGHGGSYKIEGSHCVG